MSQRAALVAVLLAWGWALLSYAGMDLSRDDLCYVGTLHDFLLGFEARKDYGHVAWGLLHTLGHAPGQDWSEGHIGGLLSTFATTIVPFAAWVVFRLASAALPGHRDTAHLAAALVAWSPAVMMGASHLGFWARAGSVGFALLGVASLLDAMRSGSRAQASAAVLLQAVGLALHPWAITGPAVGGLLLLARAGRSWRDGDRSPAALAAAVLVADGLLFLGLLAFSGQGHRAANSQANLVDGLLFLPQAAAAHGAWQIPLLGRAMTLIPGPAAAATGLLGALALLASPRCRPAGLLALGGLAAALPEAAAVFLPADWRAAWTGNLVKASSGMELVAPIGVAAALALLPDRRRLQLLGLALVLLSALRAVPLTRAKAATARADAASGRLVGELLAGSAAVREKAAIVGPAGRLSQASFAGRYNPEVPAKSPLRRRAKEIVDRPERGGLDYALWRTSTARCELWMGWSRPDGIIPDDPTAFQRSPCSFQPRAAQPGQMREHACVLRLDRDVPQLACPERPPHAPPGRSRDPAAWPLALLGFLGIGAGLWVSRAPHEAPRILEGESASNH